MNLFETALEMMNEHDAQAMAMSMNDVHHKGLFSLVINGTDHGELTRIFIATKKIKPFAIQLHSHRYDLEIGVIKGEFMHHQATYIGYGHNKTSRQNCVELASYDYKSPLNGGNGLEYISTENYLLDSYYVPVGGELKLHHENIHTVSASKGAMWIVREKGFKTNASMVCGVPFKTDDLYNAPSQYEIAGMWQKAFVELRKLARV